MEQLELFERAPGMTKSTLKAWVDYVLNNPVDQDQLYFALAVKNLLEENARYREALEFYADEQNWFWDGTDNSEICSSDWDKDSEGLTFGGRRAREALKGEE